MTDIHQHSAAEKNVAELKKINVAVMTVSDTRTSANDTSGDALAKCLREAGHHVADRKIVKDDIYQIRAVLSQWIVDPEIQAVITTGGTGFSGRDSTPEAIAPLFDKHIEGFGELFRAVSYTEIGSSTLQSRALAGLANNTVIFCVPGSTGACLTAWEKIIKEQLDSRHKPCNFVGVLQTRIQGK
jgi:molybdopterin adenylyltransferase